MPRPLDEAIGSWSLYWIGFFQTGNWFTPSYSGSDRSNTNTVGGLPNRICDGNLPTSQRTVNAWFQSSCLSRRPRTFGNSGENILEGPGEQSQQLSITKVFNLTERFQLQFSAISFQHLQPSELLKPRSEHLRCIVGSDQQCGRILQQRQGWSSHGRIPAAPILLAGSMFFRRYGVHTSRLNPILFDAVPVMVGHINVAILSGGDAQRIAFAVVSESRRLPGILERACR